MRRKRRAAFFWAAVAVVTIGIMPGAIAHDGGPHVMYIRGISNISNQCEYIWEDGNPNLAGIQPIRDSGSNIPKPVMFADGPHCRDADNNPLNGVQIVPCSIARNTGPYPPPDRERDLLQGEVGLKPPCKGDISASDVSGLTGCASLGTTFLSDCGINSPTWYYGYCGQTFGGAAGGTFTYGGQTFTINRMGFPRGRGIWEFNGVMTASDGHQTTFRYYLGAAPDQPSQALGCDVTNNLTSIVFTGVVTVPAQGPRLFAAQPGWHWCDGTDGCG